MKQQIILTTIIVLALSSQLVRAASITDTYATGDTLTAAKMDNIKTSVNDNDTRVTTNAADISANDARLDTLESVKTGYVSVSSMNATPIDSTVTYAQCQIGIVGKAVNSGGLKYLDVNIQIPHGATITQFTYVAYDVDATNDSNAVLGREESSHSWLANVSTTGSTGMQTIASSTLNSLVDNTTQAFFVRFGSNGASGCDLVPMKAIVTYTYK